MSGQQIGTVVGGIAGFAIGGPAGAQLGMAIGGLVGGIIDPTKINGPKIGDGQTQQSTDGIAIAWVQGTARIAGTLVQYGPRRQVKVKDSSGKGGPSVHHYEAHQDFAILVCESCSLRDSTMSQVLIVEQDGHIVYDVRPGSTILSDSAKWKANVDFLYGDEEQLPHPTLEAITGVGNQVAYRGSLVVVFRNFNLTTNSSNRIPSFVFTVASSGSPALTIPYDDPDWKWKVEPPGSTANYSSPTYDDSSWATGRGGFGSSGYPSIVNTAVSGTPTGQAIWIRRTFSASPGVPLTVNGWADDQGTLWWNGVDYPPTGGGFPEKQYAIPGSAVLESNVLAFQALDVTPTDILGAVEVVQLASDNVGVALSTIASRVVTRGGLSAGDYDASALSGINVLGYPIARQSSGTDALSPLLAGYFAYATEYDAKLWFHLYGADATITIADEDLLAGNDANDGYITKNLRNQQTEFPRRIVASYFDPAQNYFTCQVPASRIAIGVKSIGDQAFDIPVVMDATTAQQAVDKALKVAYATLEGTEEFSVPFATRNATYLTLAAGDPIILNGKRYVLDEAILSTNYVKLTARYDRQSAYVSNVQAIAGNPPEPPASPYSGATELRALNLPPLRPQDTTGVYLAAAGVPGNANWIGCNAFMSLDNQTTWNQVASMSGSIMGTLVLAEPTSHEPLTVQVNGDLQTITADQFDAQGNPFALTSNIGLSELGQFLTAVETTTVDEYELTGLNRGMLGTTEVMHAAGDAFTMLDNVYFVPIAASFAGRTIYFKAPGYGEDFASAAVISIVFQVIALPSQIPDSNRIDVDGDYRVDADGNLRICR